MDETQVIQIARDVFKEEFAAKLDALVKSATDDVPQEWLAVLRFAQITIEGLGRWRPEYLENIINLVSVAVNQPATEPK